MSSSFLSQSRNFLRILRNASTTKKPSFLEKPIPPPGVFGLYLREKSDEFRSKNAYLNQNELIRLIGDQWKELPSTERDNYRKLYLEKVSQYNQQLIEFEDSMDDNQRIVQALKDDYENAMNDSAAKVPVEFPRRPATAFAHFLQAARETFPKNENQSTADWNESMAQQWRHMNESEKKKFRVASKKSYMKFAMEKEDKETFSLDEVGGFQR